MLAARRDPTLPTESRKPLIIISYAHADEPDHPAEGQVKWLSFVTSYLKPAVKAGRGRPLARPGSERLNKNFAVAAELAARGYFNERGKPFNPKSVSVLLAS
jgi:hypothetical protein